MDNFIRNNNTEVTMDPGLQIISINNGSNTSYDPQNTSTVQRQFPQHDTKTSDIRGDVQGFHNMRGIS